MEQTSLADLLAASLQLETLPPADLNLLVSVGILRAVRRTANQRVTEYAITHAGRVLLECVK